MTGIADVLDTWAAAPAINATRRAAVVPYRAWRESAEGQANTQGYPVDVLDPWAALKEFSPQWETGPKQAWQRWRADHQQPTTLIGLYAWPTDYVPNADRIADLGITTMRVAHDRMNQACADTLTAHRVTAFVTVSADPLAAFPDRDAWIAAYLARVDTMLGYRCFDALEVCNEVFLSNNYGPDWRTRAANYGALLVATHAHVKANWPGITVAAFSLTGNKTTPADYLDLIFTQVPDAAHAFDAVTMHPYTNPLPPDVTQPNGAGWTITGQTEQVRAKVAQYGGPADVPVWWTELGWQVNQGAGPLAGAGKVTAAKTNTFDQQADYTVRLIDVARQARIARVTFMYVVDVANNGNFGWFRNGQPRPVAAAVSAKLARR